MVLNFRINNYKSINKEIELDLSTNLFFISGKENSGKTSIIDSLIFAISHIISPVQFILNEQILFYKTLLLNYEKRNENCMFEITFKIDKSLYKYCLELNNSSIAYEFLEINNDLMFKREKNSIQKSDLVNSYEIDKYIDESVPLISTIIISKKNEELNKLYEYLKKSIVIDSMINSLIVKDNTIEELCKEKTLVLKVLKKIDKRYQDFKIENKKIISIYNNGMEIEFTDESTTIQNILLYIPQIINAIKTGRIIVIDDIDRKFSKEIISVIKELLFDKKINKYDSQLLSSINDKDCIGDNDKVLWI